MEIPYKYEGLLKVGGEPITIDDYEGAVADWCEHPNDPLNEEWECWDRAPKTTTITFTFPDRQTVDYQSDNVNLADFTKEKIVEKRLVNVMVGTVIETESERLIRVGAAQGAARMIVELAQEYGFSDEEILRQMQEKIGLSLEEAENYLEQYGKQLV